MGKSKTKTQSTIDPKVMSKLDANLANAQALAARPFQAYSGPLAPSVPQATTAAIGTAGNVAGYTPQQVAGPVIAKAPKAAANVTAQTAASGMGQYMNPYIGQVMDSAISDLDRARQIAQVGNAQASTAGGGAFGGSRLGVADAETNRAFLDSVARTSAGLRSQAFDTAAGLGASDASRALQASQGNQNVGIANADIAMRTALANQQTGLTSSLANQQAGLAGAGVNLNAANTLGTLGTQQFGMEDTAAQRAYQEFLREQQTPYLNQDVLNKALGMYSGAAGTQQSQQQQSQAGGILGGVGSIVGGVAMFF